VIACPSDEIWQAYISDVLDTGEDRLLTDHVQRCSSCESRLSNLVSPSSPLPTRSAAEPESPAELIEDLQRLWNNALADETPSSAAFWPQIDGYEIRQVLGRGGMGIVYRARQLELGRDVALKMIATGELSAPADVRRLLNDASTAAQLRHDHIVPLFSVGQHRGHPYYVMELIEGGSLAQRMGDVVSEPREAARLLADVARALDYAHEHGVCHRDVKPANILLRVRCGEMGLVAEPQYADSGRLPLRAFDACLTDFGLARQTHQESGLTQTGAVVGTPGYIAPEQIRSEQPTPAADVFSLGAVLYECLTGQAPFRGAAPFDALLLTMHEEPRRPRFLNHRVHRDLETVCLKCLEKDPRQRYSSSAALAADLEKWLRGAPVSARRTGPLGRLWRRSRRHPLIACLTSLLVLALCGGVSGILYQWRQAELARREAVASDDASKQLIGELVQASPMVPLYYVNVQDHLPKTEPLRKAEAHCRYLLERNPADLALRATLTNVECSLGSLGVLQGKITAAAIAFQNARDLWEPLFRQDPANPHYRDWLATICFWQSCGSSGNYVREYAYLQQADALWQDLAEEHPDSLDFLDKVAECHFCLVRLGATGAGRDDTRHVFEDSRRQLLEQLHAKPTSKVLLNRLALSCFMLGEIDRWKESRNQASVFWKEAYQYLKAIAASPQADPLVKFSLGLCCYRLIGEDANDPYYPEAARMFKQAGDELTLLVQKWPDGRRLGHTRLESYRYLALCHWKVGANTLAEQTIKRYLGLRSAHATDIFGPLGEMGLLDSLLELGSALREAKKPALALVQVREAQALLESFRAAPTSQLHTKEWSARSLLRLATLLKQLHEPADALRYAEQSRLLFGELSREYPEKYQLASWISNSWEQIGKARWDLYQPDMALAAFRESAAFMRRACELAPLVETNRLGLSRSYERIASYGGEHGDWSGAADALALQEKVWTGNQEKLLAVAENWQKLAKKMRQAQLPIELHAAAQRYFEHGEETKRAAERLVRQ
jgi:serine/threonine protein kinase